MTRAPTEMELRVERVLTRFDFDEDRLHVARAVIRAMREPTNAMYDAADGGGDYNTRWIWETMIDAASPEN